MEFCKECGNILIRQLDGTLVCRKGHIVSDDVTKKIQEEAIKRRQERKERELTFPNPKEVEVFRLVNPYTERQKTGLTPNASSFPFYHWLNHELVEDYGPKDFRYIAGNTWAEGSVEHKFGLIFIRCPLVSEISDKIQGFELSDGTHFMLEQLNYSQEQKLVLVKQIKEEIIAKFTSEQK